MFSLIFLTECTKKEDQTNVPKKDETIIITTDKDSIEADGLDKASISLKRKDSKGIVVGIGASFVLKTRDGTLEFGDCERVGDRKECILPLIVGVSPAGINESGIEEDKSVLARFSCNRVNKTAIIEVSSTLPKSMAKDELEKLIKNTTEENAKEFIDTHTFQPATKNISISCNQPDLSGIQISSDPYFLNLQQSNENTFVTIRAVVSGKDGKPVGTNKSITLSTNHGEFRDDNGNSSENIQLRTNHDSVASTKLYRGAETEEVIATVTAVTKNSYGIDEKTTLSIPFSNQPPSSINLTTSSNIISPGSGVARLTAVIKQGNELVDSGTVTFSIKRFESNIGGLYPTENLSDGGEVKESLLIYISDGIAEAYFIAGNKLGSAIVSATHLTDTSSVTILVQPPPKLGSIKFSKVLPADVDSKGIGAKGSIYAEDAVVYFQVFDDLGRPFQDGQEVQFELAHGASPYVKVFPPNNYTSKFKTNDKGNIVDGGEVWTVLSPGGIPEDVQVIAKASIEGDAGSRIEVKGISGKIVIHRQVPSSKRLTFSCNGEDVIVSGYSYNFIPSVCTVQLSNNFGQAITKKSSVQFATEAGSILGQVSISENGKGFATTTAYTGDPRPFQHTMALNPPDFTQKEKDLLYGSDGLTEQLNSVNTIIVYTNGEEWFEDYNQNGIWDIGEPFEDVGEPFIDVDSSGFYTEAEPFTDVNNNGFFDANDKCLDDKNNNGTCDPAEPFIDTVPPERAGDPLPRPNQKWDPPNGHWDNNITIWKSYPLIWIGSISTNPLLSTVCLPDDKFGVCGLPIPYYARKSDGTGIDETACRSLYDYSQPIAFGVGCVKYFTVHAVDYHEMCISPNRSGIIKVEVLGDAGGAVIVSPQQITSGMQNYCPPNNDTIFSVVNNNNTPGSVLTGQILVTVSYEDVPNGNKIDFSFPPIGIKLLSPEPPPETP